jgi:hypothetical protein
MKTGYLRDHKRNIRQNEDNNETGADRMPDPGLFLLSPISGIGYAFTLLYSKLSQRKCRPVYSVIVCFLIVIVIVLSGRWCFSEDDHYITENMYHIRDDYKRIADIMSRMEGKKRTVAAPEISPYLALYGDWELMYDYPEHGDPSELDPDIRYVYEQLKTPDPDEARIVKIMREYDYKYLIYNKSKNYFGLPLEEFGFELVEEVGDIRIYRDLSEAAR